MPSRPYVRALLIDAEGRTGNGVMLWDASSGRLQPIHTDAARFSRLAWHDTEPDLVFMEEIADDAEGEEMSKNG